MSKHILRQKRAFKVLFFIIIAITILAIFTFVFKASLDSLLKTPEALRNFSEQYPVLAPMIITMIIMLEVIIAPLPGGFLPVLTGVLFGVTLGTLYSWIGNVLGAIIAFSIAKRFGRKIIERLVERKKLLFYDVFIKKHHRLIWFTYLVPLFPIDIISVSLGLSNIRLRVFAPIVALALLPDMWLLNFLGDSIYQSNISIVLWALALTIVTILVITFIREMRVFNKKYEFS